MLISCEDFVSVELFNIAFNISIGIIISDLCLVIEFVLEILNPKSIEDASKKLAVASSTDSFGKDGDLNNFLRVFNQIESMLKKDGEKRGYIITENFSGYSRQKYISNPRLIDIFFKEGRISPDLKADLLKLVSLRNSIVHSTEVQISKADEEKAIKILESLKNALQYED